MEFFSCSASTGFKTIIYALIFKDKTSVRKTSARTSVRELQFEKHQFELQLELWAQTDVLKTSVGALEERMPLSKLGV